MEESLGLSVLPVPLKERGKGIYSFLHSIQYWEHALSTLLHRNNITAQLLCKHAED